MRTLLFEPKKAFKSYKGLTGFWTKYGGAEVGIATNQWGDVNTAKEWTCQSCGKLQPIELTPYHYQYPFEETLSICAVCENNGCISLKRRLGLTE